MSVRTCWQACAPRADCQPARSAVSRHGLVVDVTRLGHLVIILCVYGDRARGWLAHQASHLTWCLALASAALSLVSCAGWGRVRERAAGRAIPVGLCRRPLL